MTFAVPGSEAGSATETVSPSAGVPTICGVALYWTGIGPYCVTAGSKPGTERPATLRSTSAGSSPSPRRLQLGDLEEAGVGAR